MFLGVQFLRFDHYNFISNVWPDLTHTPIGYSPMKTTKTTKTLLFNQYKQNLSSRGWVLKSIQCLSSRGQVFLKWSSHASPLFGEWLNTSTNEPWQIRDVIISSCWIFDLIQNYCILLYQILTLDETKHQYIQAKYYLCWKYQKQTTTVVVGHNSTSTPVNMDNLVGPPISMPAKLENVTGPPILSWLSCSSIATHQDNMNVFAANKESNNPDEV